MKVVSIDKKFKCNDCNTVAIFEIQQDEESDSITKVCGKHLPVELQGLRP